MSQNDVNPLVRLRGKNINLGALRVDDEAIKAYTKWMNDETIIMNLGRNMLTVNYPYEEKHIREKQYSYDEHRFNILLKDDTLIGNCDITLDNRIKTSGRIGICIGEEVGRDKGYGTEAISMLVKYGFNELAINRISLGVLSTNSRAIACYKKVGFRFSGISRLDSFIGGKFVDTCEMELLAEDWFAMQRGETVLLDTPVHQAIESEILFKEEEY